MNPLDWYASEEEKAWGEKKEPVGDSLEKM